MPDSLEAPDPLEAAELKITEPPVPVKPKRKTHTSNAVKKRYNDKTYSKYSFLVPKNGGLDNYIKSARDGGGSIGELVRRALIEYSGKHKTS